MLLQHKNHNIITLLLHYDNVVTLLQHNHTVITLAYYITVT